jgi:hypothetical protein
MKTRRRDFSCPGFFRHGDVGVKVGIVAGVQDQGLTAVDEFQAAVQDVHAFCRFRGSSFCGSLKEIVADVEFHVVAGFAAGQDLVVISGKLGVALR